MQFNFDNDRPIYIQLLEQLKLYIISGNIKPGAKLPSVRDLALKNKVNPNTMQKALIELEALKLIYTERTTGKFITTDKKLIEEYKKGYAKSLSLEYLKKMYNLGYSKEEIEKIIEKVKGE